MQPFAGERTFSSADSALAELPRWQSIINWILLYFPSRVLQVFPPVTLLTLKPSFVSSLKLELHQETMLLTPDVFMTLFTSFYISDCTKSSL